MRMNHTKDKITIIRSGSNGSGAPEPQDQPIVSMVGRSGVLQRIYGYDDASGWAIQIFESHNPITSTHAPGRYQSAPWFAQPAYGYHNVLVATAEKTPDMEGHERWTNMLVAMQDRMRYLYDQARVGYIAVFADMNGADIAEPHLQMVTFPVIPPTIAAEVKASDALKDNQGACSMCQIMGNGASKDLQILRSNDFVAICPWAPSRPYEFWIAPRRHSTSFLKTTQMDLADLGRILWSTLKGLDRVLPDISFSLAFHLSSEKRNTFRLHWHVEVYPNTPVPAALDRGFGVSLCHTSPEESAKALAAASRREWSSMAGVDL